MKEFTLNHLIAEIALECADPHFEDFGQEIYLEKLKRANRIIAKKYNINSKIYQFHLRDYTSNLDEDIELELEDFKAEFLVNVNGVDLKKVNDQLIPDRNQFCYYLELINYKWVFNYVLNGWTDPNLDISAYDISEAMSIGVTEKVIPESKTGKKEDDEITILYTAIPNMDSDAADFTIPDNYQEEQIRYTLEAIARL